MKKLNTFLATCLALCAAACSPDCDVAVYKLSECTNSGEGSSQIESERRDCITGETPTYYRCWEEVSTADCQDAQKICAQYAE